MDMGRQRLLGSPEAPGNRQGGDLAGCSEGAEAFLTLPTPSRVCRAHPACGFSQFGGRQALGQARILVLVDNSLTA